jgi:glutathione S-transferase
MRHFAKKLGHDIPPEAIQEAIDNLPKTLCTMDTWIAEMGYLAGPQMTIADLIAVCDTAQFTITLNYDLSKYSNLYSWYKQMMEIPEVSEVHEAIFAMGRKVNSMVTLYGHPASPPCRSVETVLKLAGINYEYSLVDLFKGE